MQKRPKNCDGPKKSIEYGIGPQCKSDPKFMARMRFHQSWYRANVLCVPYGKGPKQNDTSERGNMLNCENGAKGFNFLTTDIFGVVQSRLKDPSGTVEKFRLLHNMLSSQPMCFNLFGQLVADHDFATKFFKRIIPNEVKKVIDVKIEYAPEPSSDYLNDRTAFDAFVDFIQPDGTHGFVGIETKLTEPFSEKFYDTPIYRYWTKLDDSPWPKESWPKLSDINHNQLWRNHLLVVAMSHQSPYTCGFLMLVRHPEDEQCTKVVDNYTGLLKSDDKSFLDYPLDKLTDKMELCLKNTDTLLVNCLNEFKKRYLNTYLSEKDWLRYIEQRYGY